MHRKRVQAVHDRQGAKAQLRRADREGKTGNPPGERPNRHAQLDPGQLGADTPGEAVPERQVRAAAAPRGEPIRVTAERAVPVGPTQRADDDVTGADPGAEQVEVVAGETRERDLDDAEV